MNPLEGGNNFVLIQPLQVAEKNSVRFLKHMQWVETTAPPGKSAYIYIELNGSGKIKILYANEAQHRVCLIGHAISMDF